MSKKFFSLVLCLLLSAGMAFAQTLRVSGVVTDSSTGEPVPGATVLVEGTLTGAASDADGKYSISVASNANLVYSAVGYVSKTVAVNGKSTINVNLDVDNTLLEDAVVVGYGSARKVSSLVGSVSTVKSDIVKNAPSSSALDQLQGQVAGLSVLSYSGVAGDNAVSMQLHGVGSLTASSTPLYIVDGVPSSSRAIMAMNPNDIESISVLKDASATSIYGSRAANGVVYISTKSGSYNSKATVTVRSQYGVSTLASLNLYKNMMSSDELKEFWVRSGIHSQAYIDKTYTNAGWTANTQWYKYMMHLNTPQYQNDVTIEGGGAKVAYLMTASQFHQEGFTPGNFYDRYTVRSNVQAHPTNWLKSGINISMSYDETQQNPNWGSAANGMSNYTSGGLSYLLIPMYPAVDEDGNVYEVRFPGQNRVTPDYYMKYHVDQYDRIGGNGNVFVEIEPIRNLKWVTRAGIDGYIRLNNWQTYPTYTNTISGTPNAGKSTAYNYSSTITNTLEYSWNINHKHEFSVLAGQEGVANFYDYFYAQSSGQTDDRQMMLQHGTTESRAMSESHSESKFLSFFGHADYSYDGRYIIDATIRNDAVSRFGSDMRNAQFWSAGFMWKIKREAFMQNVDWINDLNLKVSYGTQGNAAIGDYTAIGTVSNSGYYAGTSARYVSNPANPQLTWEQQGLFTVALTGRAFNKLDFDLEFYDRRTTNMLMDVPQPYTAGFTGVTQNVGGLQNTGVDITLGYDFLRGRDYYLRASTTFSYNANKITELFDGRQRWEIANTMVAYVVGKPIAFYLPLYAGVDPADGQPMWYVPGEDKDVTTMEETTKVFDEDALTQNSGKSRYAPINGGFSLSGGWKGLSLQADFSYVLNKYLVSNDGYFYGNPANFSTMNTHKAMNDFWTPDNTDAEYPDWSSGAVMQFDSHLLENASFLRLKNLLVGYSLPEKALAWSNNVLKGVKVTFTGRNLLTFTNYSGIDPEINSNLTYGVGGNSKQYLVGLELTF